MDKHKFWGKIEEDWAGFSAEKVFHLAHFDKKSVEIFLGEEFDEDGEEIGAAPDLKKLDEYEQTFSDFLNNLNTLIFDIKKSAFQHYQKVYAHYYEDKKKSKKEPLNLDTPDKHFEYMKDLNYIRVLDGQVIKILIRYKIDEEHGLELKLKNNKVLDISGISET
jgi:hypothetical protein